MMKPTPAGPMFKSRDEILAECATVGITPQTPVVLYCFKGARASNTLVALKEAGVENVTLYFGSWNEWSRDPSLPIEAGLPFKVGSVQRCRLTFTVMRGLAQGVPRTHLWRRYGVPCVLNDRKSSRTMRVQANRTMATRDNSARSESSPSNSGVQMQPPR